VNNDFHDDDDDDDDDDDTTTYYYIYGNVRGVYSLDVLRFGGDCIR